MSEERNENAKLNMTPEEVESLIGITKINIGMYAQRGMWSYRRSEGPPDLDITVLHLAEQLIKALEGCTFEESVSDHRSASIGDTPERAAERWKQILYDEQYRVAHNDFLSCNPGILAEFYINTSKTDSGRWTFPRQITGDGLFDILDRSADDSERAEMVEYLPASEEEIMQWRRDAGAGKFD